MTRWHLEIDLQMLCPGMARRPAVAPLLEHLRCTCGITHQHDCDRQYELQHRRYRHCRSLTLTRGWSGTFPHRGHQRLAHRLTSSGVTTG